MGALNVATGTFGSIQEFNGSTMARMSLSVTLGGGERLEKRQGAASRGIQNGGWAIQAVFRTSRRSNGNAGPITCAM